MAITATRVDPPNPEIRPTGGGIIVETWRLTGDGSATTVTITTDFIKRIRTAVGSGNWTHNITSSTANSFTVTFAAALGNNLTLDVEVKGQILA